MQPRTSILFLLILGCFLLFDTAVSLAAEVEVRLGNDGTGVYLKKVESWKARRAEHMITQAYDYSCGAAALATVMRFEFGCPLTEKGAIVGMARFGQLEEIKKRGFSLLDMKLFCQSLHYKAQGYKVPDMDTLEKFPMPVITIISTLHKYNHFIVIRRVDDRYVYLSDPAWGNRRVLRDDFEESWPSKVVFAIAGPKQGTPEGLYCETSNPGISLYQVIRMQQPGNPIAMDPTNALIISFTGPLVSPLSPLLK
jgi:uncharacterized protein